MIEEVLIAAVGHELAEHGDHAVWTCLEGPGGCYRVGGLVALVGRDDAADLGKAGVAVARSAPGGSGVGDEGGALLEGAVDEAVVGALAEDAGAGPRVRSRGSAAAVARACRRRCRLCGADAAGAQGGDRAWAMALKVPRPRVRAWRWGAAYPCWDVKVEDG